LIELGALAGLPWIESVLIMTTVALRTAAKECDRVLCLHGHEAGKDVVRAWVFDPGDRESAT
jgi:hypothetical protein